MKTARLSLLCLLATLLAAPLAAAPALAAPSHPAFGTFVNNGAIPVGSKLVISVTMHVTNDEDSGLAGYWALDNYQKTVQIWQAPDGTFYVVARYIGTFTTFPGALSPMAAIPETATATGTYQGGYVAEITGTLKASPSYATHGSLGSFDYGGTVTDIQLGTYGSGQTGDTTPFSYVSAYFSPAPSFSYINWGWTYNYHGQTWNNYQSGNSGDIVV